MSSKPEIYRETPPDSYTGDDWDSLSYDMQWYHYNKESRNESRQTTRSNKKSHMDSIKAERGCKHCTEDCPVALDFHHRNPDEKFRAVANMTDFSFDRIDEEISKCDVICANCHRKIENGIEP